MLPAHPSTNHHKLEFRSEAAIFLGYSPFHKGYKALLPSGKVVITRDILFDENTFPRKLSGSYSSSSSFPSLVPIYHPHPLFHHHLHLFLLCHLLLSSHPSQHVLPIRVLLLQQISPLPMLTSIPLLLQILPHPLLLHILPCHLHLILQILCHLLLIYTLLPS